MSYLLIAEIEHIEQPEIGADFVSTTTDKVVARFSTYERAEQYIRTARLRTPTSSAFSGRRPFSSNSVLWDAAYARIEPEEDIPFDPSL